MGGPDFPSGRIRCRHCQDVIGIYEPLVLLTVEGSSRETSLAVEPDLGDMDELCYHRDCYQHIRSDVC